MNIQQALAMLVEGENLTNDDMIAVMRQVMTGAATEAQVGALLLGLRMKGETIEEVAGAAQVMRELAVPVHVTGEHIVDIVGTGGDGANLFNVSTAATFVIAAAGGRVAKHGNRSVSSSTGSADVLEAAGIHLDLDPKQIARCIEEIGVGFMFAPSHHSAMRHAIGPRRQLAMRTIFNILGPMTNPAGVKRQLIGVFSADLCRPMAEVLARLGSEHIMIVHSKDGLDEISIAADTQVAELKGGVVTEYTIKPEDFDIERRSLEGLAVESANESLALIQDALGKSTSLEASKAQDIIALNAGAAIYVAGIAADLKEGVTMAADAIGSGLSKAKIQELASFSEVLKNV